MDNFIFPSFTVSFAFPSKYPPKEEGSLLPCFVALSVTVYTPSSVGFNVGFFFFKRVQFASLNAATA
mgnify:CR=1 FL=1